MKLVLKKTPANQQKTNKTPQNQRNKKTPKKQQQIKKWAKQKNTHHQNQNFDSISIFISWHKENCFKNFFLRNNPNWKLFYKVRAV